MPESGALAEPGFSQEISAVLLQPDSTLTAAEEAIATIPAGIMEIEEPSSSLESFSGDAMMQGETPSFPEFSSGEEPAPNEMPAFSETGIGEESTSPGTEPGEEPNPAESPLPPVPTPSTEEPSMENQFYITEITPEIQDRIMGLSYKYDCTVPMDHLRYLHVLHKNLAGETLEGEMICNRYIAQDVLEILEELYEAGYPIERIRLVDEYGASDELSMEDNNSSSFNFRFISYTTTVSRHGLGLAVDINPLYNPYIKTLDGAMHVEPDNAWDYVDRSQSYPYKIEPGDLCYSLFLAHGFEWGGDWEGVKDYQHFEIPSEVVNRLYP